MIQLVELQTHNILRLIAFTEIFLMPFVVMLLLMGRAGLFIPLIYFHFLKLRYSSRRNPHTRNMFREVRYSVETFVNKPMIPATVRSMILNAIELVSKLAPPIQQEATRQQ